MADTDDAQNNGNIVVESAEGEQMAYGSSDEQHDEHLLQPGDPMPRRSSLVKDSSRKQQRKKTVSFSSMPNERIVVNAADCLNHMQNGSELIKIRSNSRQYHRLFTLDDSLQEIRWQPSSKKPHKARIALSQIREIRKGKNTELLRNRDIAGSYPDECAFSIIYGEAFDTMDLIANSPDEANIWVTGLTCLTSAKNGTAFDPHLEDREQIRDRWLQEVFDKADLDSNGLLEESDVVRVLRRLNTGLATVKVQQKLKEISLTKDGDRGRLNSEEFINLFKEISTRPEIYFLLVRYASTSDDMSTDDLLLFLEAEQGMTRVTKDKCLDIINTFEPSKEGRRKGHLSIDGFTAYLLSDECDIFDRDHTEVVQDMSQPLAHYFIASSHNTYLLQDQLTGQSSVDGYIRALHKGCRCIELDCWDGANDEPIIYHGHTLTSKISFKSVIEAIDEHAFVSSDYPLILSIENHCSITQQRIMAQTMTDILGNKLYTESVDRNLDELPSPESLKNKILVKGKKLKEVEEEKQSEGYVTDEDEAADSEKTQRNHKRNGATKKHKLAKELSDLVNYFKSVRFDEFHVSMETQKYYEMCSFSESLALRLANGSSEEFVNHNKQFLSRIYPNGMRVDSSNYNPQDLWNCGCQLVALNYQTSGLMMDLNDGRFLQNGGCGYVLKPSIMREKIAYFSANTREVIPGVSPQILHIKIISGQQLPKPKGSGAKGDTIDPYVTVETFGIPADCAEERTKTVQHNGYNPIFDESFEFQINLPELALVRFAVLDDDFIGDEFIGQYTIPFECMQTGYRHVQLKSNSGEVIENCSLFVHIAITNKRGGGKTHRIGRKGKKKKDYTSLKGIGIKSVDETFKIAMQPLRDSTDLRDNVHQALAQFKEDCGQAPISNIKQCIRMLAARIAGSNADISLQLIIKEDYPYLESQGNIPEVLRKALNSFENLVVECRYLINHVDDVLERLVHARQAGLEWYEDLPTKAQEAGLKHKKFNKAIENFAWNIRVLKGQTDLLRQAKLDAAEYMKQVQEAALANGLMKDELIDKGQDSS